jgi:4-amino-4-deoxy-L-arabinose transferase-like glycosyltransferase
VSTGTQVGWAALWRPSALSRRAAWLVGAGVVVLGVVFGVVRYATGAGLAESVRSGVFLVVGVGCGLTVNQVATRRRARRTQHGLS